jgi:hypothetical protein
MVRWFFYNTPKDERRGAILFLFESIYQCPSLIPATTLVSDDGDKFFAEDDLLVAKPCAMPVLPISVNAGDVQRIDVPRLVLADAALDLGLFADKHAVPRFEDNLLETFEREIGLDPRRLQHDTTSL